MLVSLPFAPDNFIGKIRFDFAQSIRLDERTPCAFNTRGGRNNVDIKYFACVMKKTKIKAAYR
jgi:hypothetical protein